MKSLLPEAMPSFIARKAVTNALLTPLKALWRNLVDEDSPLHQKTEDNQRQKPKDDDK